MARTKKIKLNRQVKRKEEDRDAQVRMAQIKMESTLEKIELLGKHYQQEVENRLKLIRASSNQHLLKMKWNDFLQLQMQHFEDFKWRGRSKPVNERLTRSQSARRCNRQLTTEQSNVTRDQVQSVDRAADRWARMPTMAILRWPKPGEVALSTAGSPLAVQSFPDRVVNVHIPTKAGVIKLQPKKLSNAKCEVFKLLDATAMNQLKTINANLCMILDMSTKLGKGKGTGHLNRKDPKDP